ncbi:hypothetical protein CYY_006861 [Polysphondylium violaceum]|uniref:Uncharacterized protein n=1 Tax=Polysphondylium violaceum TaxID=133409 RepID=A0A8J4PSR9_9MYCE|nr:hypothetical protein CYY_006861 [Polysphondylium violaceum]
MQGIKKGLASTVGLISYTFVSKSVFYLSVEPDKYDHLTLDEIRVIYNSLTQDERNRAEFMFWELSKKEDCRIDSPFYGRENFFTNSVLAARSLYRCGFILLSSDQTLVPVKISKRVARCHSTPIAQYYSLGEKIHREYPIGRLGYINGMGNALAWAGTDASKLSDSMAEGNNLHCVFLPSFKKSHDNYSPSEDKMGVTMDVVRHLVVNSGIHQNKASCLLAQMWIDYLHANPTKYFLQFCASDGGTFTNSAVNLMLKYAPHYLSRLSIIALAPGCVVLPNEYLTSKQVVNLIKKEDTLITQFGTGSNHAGKNPSVLYIPHTSEHPHNFTSIDYSRAVKPYIECFKVHGRIIE